MKVFSSHLRENATPVLVREGFSLAALVFGWLYLLWHRAWIASVLNLAAALVVGWLVRITGSLAPFFGLLVLQGVLGHDLWRWGLEWRGFVPGPILAAIDEDTAMARLFLERADLPVTLASALA